jgi:hypothetical protein
VKSRSRNDPDRETRFDPAALHETETLLRAVDPGIEAALTDLPGRSPISFAIFASAAGPTSSFS